MEPEINLPVEYFDKNNNELLEENLSNNELLSIDNVTPQIKEDKTGDENLENTKLPNLNIPEKQLTESTEVLPASLAQTSKTDGIASSSTPFTTSSPDLGESTGIVNNSNNENIISRPSLDKDTILSEISKIDGKINELEGQLNNITLEEKNNFDNIINQGDNYSNNFNEATTNENNVVEVFSNNNNIQKQYIKRDLNLLKKQKIKLLNEQKKLELKQIPIIDNTEFVPNFSTETMPVGEDALQKSLEVEKFLGESTDEPKVVNDPFLGTAVISESQGNLDNAISEHGGMESALSDSISNQNNYTQVTPAMDTTPDSNAAVANTTQKILEIITTISSQLKEIAGSLKGGQQSSNTGATKSQNKDTASKTREPAAAVPSGGGATQQGKKEFEPIKNVKGDLPDAGDFPSDFDLTQLKGSNLLTRT